LKNRALEIPCQTPPKPYYQPVPSEYQFDVFLSHSAKDEAVVRPLAERLRSDGLRVWFDEWEIKPGDSIPAKIEEGLEHSRVLVLCMSANAFGSDWAQLESHTFRFRDPLNKERRFIPLRLDDAPIKGSLAQFLYINWHPAHREQEYAKLLEASSQPEMWPTSRKILSPYFRATTKQHDENLITGYARASAQELLADCNQMIYCLAGFDTVFLMSPQSAVEQAQQIDKDWLRGFNYSYEMLCLAATARKIAFDPYKQLANSAYAFWQGGAAAKDTETDLRRLYSPGISALHDLKRELMVEIANKRMETVAEPPSASRSNISSNPNAPLTRVEINKLVNRYIGVNSGYLGDFSYRTHQDFYTDLGLDIDPSNYDGTTRARFIKILFDSPPDVQARILQGILDKYQVGSSELRTPERREEIVGWIVRLRA
jgi:hypothetical protein